MADMMSDSDAYMVESDHSEEDFFDDDEAMDFEPAPKKAASKSTKTTTAVVAGVLSPKESALNKAPAAKKGKDKTVEERYQKKTQLEHILIRPDTYSKFPWPHCSESWRLRLLTPLDSRIR